MYNPFIETERLQKIGYKLQLVLGRRVGIVMDLFEQDYYNMDSTHISLLERLKNIEEEIRILKSDENYIRGTQTSDVVQNLFNKIDNLLDDKGEDDLYTTPQEWKKFKEMGK